MTHKLNRRWIGMAAIGLLMAATTAGALQSFYRVGGVEAFETDIWTVRDARGGTRVVVDGDGDTDLDCYVNDEKAGQLLGKDDDSTDYCIVDFTKQRGGNIEIKIVNLGDVWNRYELSMN